jgi:hypothetical protein
MAEHRVVRSGTWLYDQTVTRPVYIVQLDFDFWYEIAREENSLEANEQPTLNADGHQYYVSFRGLPREGPIWVDSIGFDSVELASEHAQSRVPTPVVWNR